KYYRFAFTKYHEKKSYISNNMYQIKAYIEAQKPTKKQIKGVLLYPSNPYEFYDQFCDEEDNIIAFKTINLGKDWSSIEEDLAEIFLVRLNCEFTVKNKSKIIF